MLLFGQFDFGLLFLLVNCLIQDETLHMKKRKRWLFAIELFPMKNKVRLFGLARANFKRHSMKLVNRGIV